MQPCQLVYRKCLKCQTSAPSTALKKSDISDSLATYNVLIRIDSVTDETINIRPRGQEQVTANILTHESTLGNTNSIDQLTHRFIDLWWQCGDGAPRFERTYTPREQAEREEMLNDFLDTLGRLMKQPIRTEAQRQATQQQFTALGAVFARAALGFDDSQLEAVQSSGIVDAASDFARQARRFDASLSSDDIYQASRNVMTMNLLQLAIGLPVQVTPSIFAYSMLYPYSDNYLDDPTIPGEVKQAFNLRFRLRLMGEPFTPQNAYEQKITSLIAMIEGQFDRVRFPLVHQSLLDIFVAQAKSLRLHQRARSPYELDVLGLSFEKGGAAVVADMYLVAGTPTARQLEIAYGYGAFTQLMDDLEDVERDRADGILTVFSHAAGTWPLDGLTNRLFSLGDWVLERLPEIGSATPKPLQGLMQSCVHWLLADSAANVDRYYTRSYIASLERHMPFRFGALKKQRQRLNRQRTSLMKFIEMSGLQDQILNAGALVKSPLQSSIQRSSGVGM